MRGLVAKLANVVVFTIRIKASVLIEKLANTAGFLLSELHTNPKSYPKRGFNNSLG